MPALILTFLPIRSTADNTRNDSALLLILFKQLQNILRWAA